MKKTSMMVMLATVAFCSSPQVKADDLRLKAIWLGANGIELEAGRAIVAGKSDNIEPSAGFCNLGGANAAIHRMLADERLTVGLLSVKDARRDKLDSLLRAASAVSLSVFEGYCDEKPLGVKIKMPTKGEVVVALSALRELMHRTRQVVESSVLAGVTAGDDAIEDKRDAKRVAQDPVVEQPVESEKGTQHVDAR